MEQPTKNGLRFDRVKKAIEILREQEKHEKVADIKRIDFETMKPRTNGDYGYVWERDGVRVFTKCTLTEREQAKTPKEQREKLTAKEIKHIQNKYNKYLTELNLHCLYGDATAPEQVEMSIDWTQSRTWRANPCARVWVNGYGYAESERVTGCGYCKRSTAAADALSQIGQLKTIITALLNTYKTADIVKILKSGYNRGAATLGAYGFYFGGLAYGWGAGCGMSAINEELRDLGYKQLTAHEPNSGSDFYLWQFDKTSENGRKVLKALRAGVAK